MADANPSEETQESLPTDEGQEQEKPEGQEEGGEGGEGGEAEAKAPETEEGEGAGEEKVAAEKDAEPQDSDEKRKRVGGWQRKIERQERELAFLREQLMVRQGPPQPASKPDAEKTPEEKAAEYIDSLVEKRLTQREQEKQAQARVAEFQRRTAEVRAANPDFDDVVLSADAPISPALEGALLTSEHGPAIMYQLAKSPAELARICALPPLDAAREIGRLEAKLASGTPPPKTTKPALRPPAPPTSVNGSTSSTRSLDDLPLSEYKRAYRSGRR